VTGLLLRNAELDGRIRADLRISGGRVTDVAPALRRRPGEATHDCQGGAVLPGLCDHHLHLHAMAAWAESVRCGPPEVTDRAGLAAALATAPADARGWIRGVGYTESVAGHLDAAALDGLRADRPVRLQHRSGALWMLNTAALVSIGALVSTAGLAAIGAAAGEAGVEPGGVEPGGVEPGGVEPGGVEPGGVEQGADGRPTGRLWRADAWLRSRLPGSGPPVLAPVGAALLRHGITAITDATPDLDAAAIAAISDAMGRGDLPQRVHLLGAPLSVPFGATLPGPVLAGSAQSPAAGPYKIVLADSGLPRYDELTDRIRAAHAAGRPVAVHCVTREALVLLLAALGDAGPRRGDRIEHAALIPAELVPELVRLGVRVVTQPGFLPHRGDDFLRELPPDDHPDLYRCATLRQAGIPVALSSDAPYGPLDPWAVIAAAVDRRTASGQVAGPAERITFGQALGAYLAPPGDPGGPPRRVRPGMPADLVVLHTPLADVPGQPEPVQSVLVGGTIIRPESGMSFR
jgi:predicted amidohydrolase YtcJ